MLYLDISEFRLYPGIFASSSRWFISRLETERGSRIAATRTINSDSDSATSPQGLDEAGDRLIRVDIGMLHPMERRNNNAAYSCRKPNLETKRGPHRDRRESGRDPVVSECFSAKIMGIIVETQSKRCV